ncbi:hypothetical protein QBC34DRAFT_314276, partial [Podospora aff. communis PSN243]
MVPDSNVLQHFPPSRRAASHLTNAPGERGTTCGGGIAGDLPLDPEDGPTAGQKRQLVGFPLGAHQLAKLDAALRLKVEENIEYGRFSDFTIYLGCKNTKLQFMSSVEADASGSGAAGFKVVADRFREQWDKCFDAQLLPGDKVFVDVGKQTTAVDTGLPYDEGRGVAETFLYRNCCLEAVVHARERWLDSHVTAHEDDDDEPREDDPRVPYPALAYYPWAMTGEAGCITLTSNPGGLEAATGLVYSQYYNLVKAPFDAQKVYALQPPAYENLALDPLYVRQLAQHGRAVTINQQALRRAYLMSKKRAALSIRECGGRSYGVREEHRVTMTLFSSIYDVWDRVAAAATAAAASPNMPLPWFSIRTDDMMDFLKAQCNRHCFLFEHISTRTSLMFSLAETVVMVIALRCLRYCYGSSAMYREPLLFGDEWTQKEWTPQEVGAGLAERRRMGLAMCRSMVQHGFGWWKPGLFQWEMWRFKSPVTRMLLVGNLLVHAQYRRRWRAVRDVQNINVSMLQARLWYDDHQLATKPEAQAVWSEFLHCVALRQFDLDVWAKVHDEDASYPELLPAAEATRRRPPVFCWEVMKGMFYDRGREDRVPTHPHLITGNKTPSERLDPMRNIEILFRWNDKHPRKSWSAASYRVVTQLAHASINSYLGPVAADKWLADLLSLVLLTRWILPYSGQGRFIDCTKSAKTQTPPLIRRCKWFSTTLARP